MMWSDPALLLHGALPGSHANERSLVCFLRCIWILSLVYSLAVMSCGLRTWQGWRRWSLIIFRGVRCVSGIKINVAVVECLGISDIVLVLCSVYAGHDTPFCFVPTTRTP